MSFLLRHIARYAAQKLASNPRARETAAKAARVIVDEAKQRQVQKLHKQGYSIRQIAREVGIATGTVQTYIRTA